MKISFDIDDTLTANNAFSLERQSALQRILGVEQIRLGTKELFKELRKRGHKIWIYTTSFRSVTKIRFMFFSYGIPVDEIINQQIHVKTIKKFNLTISKYPSAFGIDLHIDDSPGVGIEGELHGFKTIIVSVNDQNWVNTVLQEIQKMSNV